jgi:hypothetical protein
VRSGVFGRFFADLAASGFETLYSRAPACYKPGDAVIAASDFEVWTMTGRYGHDGRRITGPALARRAFIQGGEGPGTNARI